ncbi:DUF4350 domain-containing protein [Lederbergia lenta]|uniref:DUF4350 domain-containing protein n=1 Tax=Lederbergia lenta TaxID=1467 RepID=UPI00203C0F7F|nr:DUF4350 domain-containing protein [Lederbergia lenta]MCM3112485.1 DUF4350 domain-containing protein [Lederbergia lenta]
MQKQISNKRMWIWLSLLLIVFMFSSYFIIEKQPKEYPMFASDSPSPTGVKAFYTYLKNNNDAVKRWSVSPEKLPSNTGKQVLVMIEPYFIPDSVEIEAYEAFMQAGNTILLFHENPKGMFDLSVELKEADLTIVKDRKGKGHRVEETTPVRLQPTDQDEVLLSDEAGTMAFKRSVGDGQLIVSNSPVWLTNGKILKEDHLPLILSLINEADANIFLFDEYIHGGKNAKNVLTLYPRWFLLLMLQGVIVTILWLWYRGKRFGPIFIPREETVRYSDEGVRALAAWYIRGRRYHDSLVIQADYVKLLLQERWRIPYRKEWNDLFEQLEQKWPHMPKAEIQSLLNGLTNILEKETMSKQEYLLWSKRIERMRKEEEEE